MAKKRENVMMEKVRKGEHKVTTLKDKKGDSNVEVK